MVCLFVFLLCLQFIICSYFRGVTDAINNLLNACMTAAPGQKECDSAVRNVQVCLTLEMLTASGLD